MRPYIKLLSNCLESCYEPNTTYPVVCDNPLLNTIHNTTLVQSTTCKPLSPTQIRTQPLTNLRCTEVHGVI